MTAGQINRWPAGIDDNHFSCYQPRRMESLGLWCDGEWAIKVYGIQSRPIADGSPLIREELVHAAHDHAVHLAPLTREEGEFYKTGFAVLHEGAMANWLLFQWWTHQDVWCQLLSYAESDDPLAFKYSNRPVRACVYETAVIWHEQKSWIRNVLNGAPDRKAYLDDVMHEKVC